MAISGRTRNTLGGAGVSAALVAFVLAFTTDIVIFTIFTLNHSGLLWRLVDSYHQMIPKILTFSALTALAALCLSAFGDGLRRALGIVLSLAALFFCSTLGLGQ